MSSGSRYVVPYATAFDTTGIVSPEAYLNFYVSGTSTRQNTYSNVGLTIPNANPVQADGAGLFPNIFLTGEAYKVVLTTADGDEIWTADPVYGSGVAGSADLYGFVTTADLLSAFGGGVILVDGTQAETAGRTVEGDGGGGHFYYDESDTTTADNGGTVRVDSQNRRWICITPNPTPLLFGAKGDAVAVTDAAITTDTLSTASYVFTSADVGKTVGIRGAGAAGATLITSIASISAGNAVLSAGASTPVTNAAACFGTDDSTALQNFIAAFPAGMGNLAAYKYICTEQLKFCQNDTVAAGLYGTPGTYDAYSPALWSCAIFFLLSSSTTDAITDDSSAFNPRPMTFRDIGFCMFGTGRDCVVVTEAKNPYWANVAVLYSGRDGVVFAPHRSFNFVEKGVYINVTAFNNGRHGFVFTTSVDNNYISEMSFYGCEVRGVGTGGAPIYGSTTGGTFASGTQIADITWISFAPNLEDASEASALCAIRLVAVAGKSNSFGRWKFFNCGMENTVDHATPKPWINEDATIQGDGWFVEPAAFSSNYTPYSNGYIGLTVHPGYDGIATFSGQSSTNGGSQVIKSLSQSNGDATVEASVPGSGSAIILLDLASGTGLIRYQRGGVLKAQMLFNQSGQAFIDYETNLSIRKGVNGTTTFEISSDASNPINVYVGGALQQVTAGAPNSGGAGYRQLIVPN